MNPIVLSEKIFSRQAKLTKKSLAHSKLSLSQARELLARVYGHRSDHAYLLLLKESPTPVSRSAVKTIVQENYHILISRLVDLGDIDGQVAKFLLKKLWPEYLGEPLERYRQHTASFVFDQAFRHFVKGVDVNGCTKYHFDGLPSIKDAIEAQGLPHTQIAMVNVDCEPVQLTQLVTPDETYEVLAPGSKNKGKILLPLMPEGVPRFLLDINLGRLARHIRMLGFDTLLPKDNIDDGYLAEEAAKQNRILLSRDKGLLKRAIVKYGYWVFNDDPKRQLDEVAGYYNLRAQSNLFSRCIDCNGILQPVEKQDVLSLLPTLVARDYDTFKQCQSCEKVYWRGSHFDNMNGLISQLQLDKNKLDENSTEESFKAG